MGIRNEHLAFGYSQGFMLSGRVLMGSQEEKSGGRAGGRDRKPSGPCCLSLILASVHLKHSFCKGTVSDSG